MKDLKKTQALIVGAGPVGMFTALLLARNGIQVTIIDQESQASIRSYACVLHSETLALLRGVQLAEPLLQIGTPIRSIGFFDSTKRRAETPLNTGDAEYPFVLALPQSSLEAILEHALSIEHNVEIHWNHRLSRIEQDENEVVAEVDKLVQSGKGYGSPDWDWSVQKTWRTQPQVLIGADGYHSHVRECLDIDYERLGEPARFVIYEFASSAQLPAQTQTVFTNGTTNVFWPLPDNRGRWSFELLAEYRDEFPAKDRGPIVLDQPRVARELRLMLDELLQERAPWFKAPINEIEWSTEVQFQPSIVPTYGRNRCWLVGDSAHQAAPMAVQSMNTGFREAMELVERVKKLLTGSQTPDVLGNYGQRQRQAWEHYLNALANVTALPGTEDWIQQHAAPIAASLPVAPGHLSRQLRPLGLTVSSV